MKARKLLCAVLSLMLILTAFPGMVFAGVTDSPYAQEPFVEYNFDSYTDVFDYATAQSGSYNELTINNYNKDVLNVTLTPFDRDGGKAIAYSAEAGSATSGGKPEIGWDSSSFKENVMSFSADMDFSQSVGKTGLICDIQVKSIKDSFFIASKRVFSFARTEDGVYLRNAEKIVEDALIPDGWHNFNMVVDANKNTATMYMDGALLSVCDLSQYNVDLSGGFQGPRFGALSDIPFAFDNVKIEKAGSHFYTEYDGISYKAGDAYLFDAYVTDEEFGSAVAIYAGDVQLEYTTEKEDGEAYRFEGVISADVPVGETEISLVSLNGANKIVLDSFPAKIISAVGLQENIHNFDSLINGDTVKEGDFITNKTSGISTVAADTFSLTNAAVGVNTTTKLKTTVTNSTAVFGMIDSYPTAGGVHEIELDWYPITPSNSFIGFEIRPNDYKFDFNNKPSAHYKVICNNELYDGDKRTLEQKWYHLLCRVYLEPELRYEFYLDGELAGKGNMNTTKDTASSSIGLRIDVGCMKENAETLDVCYLDNIAWRNYQIASVSGAVEEYKIGSASFDAINSVIPAPATEICASLTEALTANGAYVKGADGQAVSGTSVTVDGTDVKAVLSSVLAAGEYKIVIPASATYADGEVVGSNIEIPFEVSADFTVILPAGDSFNKGDNVDFSAYVPDMSKTVEVYVDDEYVTTLTATDNFINYEFATEALDLGEHIAKFKYDGKYYYATFNIEHALSTDVVAKNTFDGANANPLTAGAQASHVSAAAITDGNGSKAMAAYVKHTLDAADSGKVAATKGKKSHLTPILNRENKNTRTGNLYVIEEDMWFGNVNDVYWYECAYLMNVPENRFYELKDSVLTPATQLNRPYWNFYILNGGKIGNFTPDAETWYSIKTVFDFDNSVYYIYVDGELVTAPEGVALSWLNVTGKTYYYNDNPEAGVTVDNSTKITTSNVNEILGPVKGISGFGAYHQFASTVSYNAHGDAGYENYHKVLMRDNLHVYTQIPVPSIVSFEENTPEGTTTLGITLDSPYDAASVASKENIRVYADGVEIPYASAAIDGNVVTVTLSEGAKANTKLEVVFLDTLLLKDGASEAGATSRATFFVTKDDIYLGTKVTFADGKANAKLFCKNYGEASGNVLAALSGKAGNELKTLDADEFVLSDGFELDLSVDASECETVIVTIWNNMAPLTVAKPIAVVK